MTVYQTAAPARSDLAPSPHDTATPARPFFRHGTMLSVGAALWAGSMVVTGLESTDSTLEQVLTGIGSGAFQVGLLALLRVLWRTEALGGGRFARGVLRLVSGMVVLAMGSTFVDAVGVSDLTRPGWILLDAFWPLSMMAMFLIGIRIAVAGRWKGLTRFWPLVAESWAVVVIPTLGIFGYGVAGVVAPLHLLVGYTVLGQLVARKPA